jgi:hypothetical protein
MHLRYYCRKNFTSQIFVIASEAKQSLKILIAERLPHRNDRQARYAQLEDDLALILKNPPGNPRGVLH